MSFAERMVDAARSGAEAMKIEIDVETARKILTQLEGKVSDIRQQKTSLINLSAQTEQCWQGLSGDSLRAYIDRAIQQQDKIAKMLEEKIQIMRQEIQHIVDKDAALASMIRGSGGSGGRISGGGRHG